MRTFHSFGPANQHMIVDHNLPTKQLIILVGVSGPDRTLMLRKILLTKTQLQTDIEEFY